MEIRTSARTSIEENLGDTVWKHAPTCRRSERPLSRLVISIETVGRTWCLVILVAGSMEARERMSMFIGVGLTVATVRQRCHDIHA